MAYEKQTWVVGDTITAEKLNHMEDGIAEDGGDKIIVTITERDATEEECGIGGGYALEYSHSWQEIYDALANGTPVYIAVELGQDEVMLCPVIHAVREVGFAIEALAIYDSQIEVEEYQFRTATNKTYVVCRSS